MALFLCYYLWTVQKTALKLEIFKPIFLCLSFWTRESLVETGRNTDDPLAAHQGVI